MLVFLMFLALSVTLSAYPTLTIGSIAGTGTITTPLTASGFTVMPAGLQWTVTFTASQLAKKSILIGGVNTQVPDITVTAGPAATVVGKDISCAPLTASSTSMVCLLTGVNQNVMSNGVVANISVTLAAGINQTYLGLSNTLGASIDANAITLSGTGGTVYGNAMSCDANGDGKVDILDVQLAMRMALGLQACTIKIYNNQCNVITYQRIVNASLGDACNVGQ